MSKKKATHSSTIALNRRARFDYDLSEDLEAGLVLQGWEVKSLRAGRISLKESYVGISKNEVFLIGAHISPLESALPHDQPNPTRSRKLLLHSEQIAKLDAIIQQKGMTIVPLSMHWKRSRVKIRIAAGKGKKTVDKRQTIIKREWERDQGRLLRYRMTR